MMKKTIKQLNKQHPETYVMVSREFAEPVYVAPITGVISYRYARYGQGERSGEMELRRYSKQHQISISSASHGNEFSI